MDPGALLRSLQHIESMLDLGAAVAHAIRLYSGVVQQLVSAYLLSTTNLGQGGGAFTSSAVIRRLLPGFQMIANASLGGILVWNSYQLMFARSVRSHYSLRVMLPRLLTAVALANFCGPLVQMVIDLDNSLCRAVTSVGVPLDLTALLRPDLDTLLLNVPGATLLTAAALFVGYAVLAMAYVVRYALLVVLTVTAPVAAILFVLPETHHYARSWAGLFITSVFMQPLQLAVLAVGFALEADGVLPIRHLFALASLWIAFKVPGALHATSAFGTRTSGEARRLGRSAWKFALRRL